METSSPKSATDSKVEAIPLVKPVVRAEKPPAENDAEATVPLGKLPMSFRKTLLGTPQKEWYRLRAIRARHEETVELAETLPVVDHVLEVAPPKLIKLLRQGAITPQEIDAGFRRIRDASNALKDACRHVASLAQLEIRAWKDASASEGGGESPPLGRTG
jgi:hypothetical protein